MAIRRLILMGASAILTLHSLCLFAQTAPFGLEWGAPPASLPAPSKKRHARNITEMLYTRPTDFRDIEEVILKVCDEEGLQQAISTSGLLPGAEARRNFASAFREAVRRYGEPDEGSPMAGKASWSSARVTIFAKLDRPGFYRISVVQDGPRFEVCAKPNAAGRGTAGRETK